MSNLSIPRYDSNEVAKQDDFNYGETQSIENLNILLEKLFEATNDIIIEGLVVQERASPDMNVNITAGIAFCQSTKKMIHIGSLSAAVSITNGGGDDRIDVLEIRVTTTTFDSQQRAYRDPASGAITYQDWDTKVKYEMEAQVIEGIEGSGVAKDHTAGWIKIAEILVDAGESTSILDAKIENCTGGYDVEATANWTVETAVTFKSQALSKIKKLFRINHKEDGDHEDDIIKDKHIDWGTGANQVSAVDVPIADAGSLITATNVEAALQEIFSNPLKHTPVGTMMQFDGSGWVDNSTIPSWYACIPENSGEGCPNMVDRFVMGKVIAGSGSTGGSNSFTLAEVNLPSHTHTINHDHGAFTSGSNSVGHTHGYESYAGVNVTNNGNNTIVLVEGKAYPYRISRTSLNQSANHTHSIDVPNYTGSSGSIGSGTAFDNRPAYYSLIFIRKCA